MHCCFIDLDQIKMERDEVVERCPKMAWYKKLICYMQGIEIPLFLYFLSLGILLPAQNHFLYSRTCLYIFNSTEICSKIDKDPALGEEESQLQQTFSYYSTIQMVFLYLPSTVTTLMMGWWCDLFSLKYPLLFPHFGSAIGTILFTVYYFMEPTLTSPMILSLPSLIYGVTGASSTEIMAAFAYVTKSSGLKNRTVRVAVVESCIGLGMTFGHLISAVALGRDNTFLAFILQVCFSLYACLYVASMVPELHDAQLKQIANTETGGSIFKLIFFPSRKILAGLKIVVRKWNDSPFAITERLVLFFMIPLTTCFFVTSGISAILFSYVKKRPLSMTS